MTLLVQKHEEDRKAAAARKRAKKKRQKEKKQLLRWAPTVTSSECSGYTHKSVHTQLSTCCSHLHSYVDWKILSHLLNIHIDCHFSSLTKVDTTRVHSLVPQPRSGSGHGKEMSMWPVLSKMEISQERINTRFNTENVYINTSLLNQWMYTYM